jgi:hypothetical protein
MKAMRRGPREEDDRAELARLLPSPAEPELPGERLTVLRENLVQEIHQQPKAVDRPARSKRWAFAVVPLTVAAITAGAFALQSGPNAEQAAAAEQLGRISAAAAAEPEPQIRPDQYVYIKSVGADTHFNGDTDEPGVLQPMTDREIWFAQRQVGPDMVDSAIREGGQPIHENRLDHPDEDQNPTYEEFKQLPTDPDALLEWAYQHASGDGTKEKKAWSYFQTLIGETMLPPKLAAAVYQAAAKIPGVQLSGQVQDAVGRAGLAVSYHDESANTYDQWIFDPNTLEYLGDRRVTAEDDDVMGKAGTLLGTHAVLERGVVDGIGQVPSGR